MRPPFVCNLRSSGNLQRRVRVNPKYKTTVEEEDYYQTSGLLSVPRRKVESGFKEDMNHIYQSMSAFSSLQEALCTALYPLGHHAVNLKIHQTTTRTPLKFSELSRHVKTQNCSIRATNHLETHKHVLLNYIRVLRNSVQMIMLIRNECHYKQYKN